MLTPLIEIQVALAAPQSSGRGQTGERRCIPIVGGRFHGKLNGLILSGGADWQVLRPDGMADLDARYMLQTDSGDHIEVWSRGLRHGPPAVMAQLAQGEAVPAEAYYMRTAMRFETAAEDLQWLVRCLAIGYGERKPDQVLLKVFAVM